MADTEIRERERESRSAQQNFLFAESLKNTSNLESSVIGILGNRSIPYVLNGLQACYDGVQNVGIGKHDDASKIWKNLVKSSSSPYSDFILTENGSFDSKSFIMNGAGICASAVGNKNIVNGSVEIVVSGSWNKTSPIDCWACFLTNSSGSFFNGLVNRYGSAYYGSQRASTKTASLTKYTISYVSAKPLAERYRWINGVREYGENPTATFTVADAESFEMILGGSLNGTYKAAGKLSCIRIYNRVLTDREIKQNYLVDKLRFGV